jgi:hypothetical protein
MVHMSNSINPIQLNLQFIAEVCAESIRDIVGDLPQEVIAELDDAEIQQLISDEGHANEDEGVVVWLRLDDMTVVVWGGNEYDFEMNRLAEVKL